jgi:catecholate siderophore receptor
MSRHVGHNAQRLVQSRIGFVSVAALLCLSAPVKLTAQPSPTQDQQPAAQSPAATPQTIPTTSQPAPAASPPAGAQQSVPGTPTAAPQPPAAGQQQPQPPQPEPPPQQTTTDTPTTTPPAPDTTLPPVQVTTTPPQRRPVAQPAARPAPQVVQAPPAPAAPPAPTEAAAPAPSYQSSTSGLGRSTASLLNTPQSVNVVTQTLIREQNSTTVVDALRNVAGITFRAGEGGNQGDTPYIRGFAAQNDIFRDGIRDPGWYTRDSFAIDAIEVYKGPASFLFGRGSTGGVVNLISKLPQERTFVEGTVTANTGPGTRATLDANGKVLDAGYGPVWARVVTMGQMYDIPGRDHVEQNRYGISPSLMWKATPDTKVTLSHIYQHDFNIPDYGIPFLSPAAGFPRMVAPVPRDNWYGILSGPTPDTEVVDANITTLKFEHNFANNLKVTNTTRYNQVDRLQRNVFPEPNTNIPPPSNLDSTVALNRAQVAVTNTQFANQSEVRANFWTGPILEHTVAAAVDYSKETRAFLRNQFTYDPNNPTVTNPLVTTDTPTNFLNPNPYRFGGYIQPPTANQWLFGQATDIAAYVADQIKITKYFELLGGVRYERYNFAQDAPIAAPSVQYLQHADYLTSWRVGAVFHPTPNSSLYVMKGTSFNPSADNLTVSVATPAVALSTIALAPEMNVTTEAGAKADVLDGKLSLASAVFHTVKTNMRIPDPSNNSVTVLAGEVTADGFEASASGNITKQWAVITSFSYIHARITKSLLPFQIGAEPIGTPTYAFSLWSTYDVTPKLQVGGGAFYTGQWWSDLSTTTAPANSAYIPAYWRYDAVLAYKLTDKVTLQLNGYNLTNTFYAASAYTNWFVPGPSRTVAFTLRARI